MLNCVGYVRMIYCVLNVVLQRCRQMQKQTQIRKLRHSTKRNGGDGSIVISIKVRFTDIVSSRIVI
jgi:hypothetical protein